LLVQMGMAVIMVMVARVVVQAVLMTLVPVVFVGR